jgi:hypothetical protein
MRGCWQGKIDKKKKSGLPKIKLKNEIIFLHGHNKVDSKYFKVEI